MTKKQLFFEIWERLDKLYPNAVCTLNYKTPFELLVATQLAAQCTDARVNIVTNEMFKKYNTPEDFASLPLEIIEKEIKSTGFYKNKAKNLKECSNQLILRHNGEVPDNPEELVALSGVGRKTANVVLGEIFGKPAVVIDTHAKRLAFRMGLTKSVDPVKIEEELKKFIPSKLQFNFCHKLVYHGREICKAQKPNCEACVLNEACKKCGVKSKPEGKRKEKKK